jgi:periplasmic protein TonB
MDLLSPRAETLVAPRQDDPRRRAAMRRIPLAWWAAGIISIALHLFLAGTVLVGMRPGRVKPADNQGTVELLMVEKQGSGEPVPAASPPSPQPTPSPAPQASPRVTPTPPAPPRTVKADIVPSEPPPDPADKSEFVPQPAPSSEPPVAEATPPPPKPDQPPVAKPDPPQPAPQQQALTFNLDGTDSLSNATVTGARVIPASPDDRFRNRPPIYPRDAVLRGEHGAVTLVIHVSDRGLTTGADVVESSGYAVLDQAALEAVQKWHFRPGLKDGKSVAFDMPMRFIFETQ